MITIFTPTFNRGYTINKLYQSLKRQTCKDFEWIVIDDGSTDNTEELFHKWIDEKNDFLIQYKKVINGGKHRAINLGVKMANAEAFFIVDSDDYLVKDAIEQVKNYFEMICNVSEYAGIGGLKGFSEKDPIGGWGTYTGEYIDATNLERAQYGLLKDKAEVYKVSVLKKYPFPEFEDEKFITEGIVYDRIAKDGYKIRWFKKIIYICEYLDDGLTRWRYFRSLGNPKGYMAYLKLREEIYGMQDSSTWKFGFYFVMRSTNKIEECRERMQISLEEQKKFEEKYRQMIIDLNKYFTEHRISTIAIYGLGNVGNAFLSISDKLNICIKYGIDRRQIKNEKIPVYMLEQQVPHVDAVIITLKDYSAVAEKNLRQIFDVVVYWKDISSGYWVN